jgi:hypothetical protein
MVVYGLLGIKKSQVFIPNKEIMDKFSQVLKKESSLGYIHELASQSTKMLEATLSMDTDTVCSILEERHEIESPIFSYNNEIELSAIINLAYLSARDSYDIVRENKAGKGYADFLFFPLDRSGTGIILELKAGGTPESAIKQIKERNYQAAFSQSTRPYKGSLLLVGIAYNKNSKNHKCIIEAV